MNEFKLYLLHDIYMDEYNYTINYDMKWHHEICYAINQENKFEDIVKDADRYNKAVNYGTMYDDIVKSKHEKKEPPSHEEFMNNDFNLYICGSKEDVAKYIKDNNLGSLNKNLIINITNEEIDMDSKDTILYLMQELDGIDNLSIIADGNVVPTSLKNYYDTIISINNIIDEINSLDFSPLEKLMYLYDKVRDRYYIKEDENEDSRISRDLTSITLGDKIVCEGYSNIFDTIADKLGFRCRPVILDKLNKNSGHARNVVLVDDKKYNVKGFLYFDPTWDCKKKEDESHFDRYEFFGMSYNEFQKLNSESNYIYTGHYEVAPASKKIFRQEKKFSDLNVNERRAINRFYRIVNNEEIGNVLQIMVEDFPFNEEENEILTNKAIDVLHLLGCELSSKTFTELLYNVRKKEYYINPEKFPLSKEKIIEIVQNSRPTEEIEPQVDMFNFIFNTNLSQEEFTVEEKMIPERIEKVKLAKTLRRVLEIKKED